MPPDVTSHHKKIPWPLPNKLVKGVSPELFTFSLHKRKIFSWDRFWYYSSVTMVLFLYCCEHPLLIVALLLTSLTYSCIVANVPYLFLHCCQRPLLIRALLQTSLAYSCIVTNVPYSFLYCFQRPLLILALLPTSLTYYCIVANVPYSCIVANVPYLLVQVRKCRLIVLCPWIRSYLCLLYNFERIDVFHEN
jgi:hypothetical protein